MSFVAALAVALAMPAAASAASYGTRTLSLGAQGSDVKKLQRYLASAGHRVARDGEFGPRTHRALRATERELELSADGIATTREQRAIRRAVKDPGTGGAAYVPPPPPDKVVPGAKGTVTPEGFAVPPESAPEAVKQVIAAGNEIATTPYKWGGGHARWDDTGYDCSGSVSYALHGAGLLDSALVSGDFARWGAFGQGRWITIYANGGHVYMVVAGIRFDTSARTQTGSRWTMEQRDSAGFSVTHPKGL
jgi:peptidoglycan hydrolase-like protein with peptidoglycan-binding domain